MRIYFSQLWEQWCLEDTEGECVFSGNKEDCERYMNKIKKDGEKMDDNGFAAAQKAYDNMTPDDSDEGCPECGAEVIEGSNGFECTECDWYTDNEPDIPDDFDAPEPDCWKHGMDA